MEDRRGAAQLGVSTTAQTLLPLGCISQPSMRVSNSGINCFFMAEGNYPFASTYIPFSMGIDIPFPPWPTRVGCAAGLDKDLGIRIVGNVSDVKYKLSMGAFELDVDWANVTGNGKDLTKQQIDESGIFDLVRGYADFNAVLANITGKYACYGEESDELTQRLAEAHDQRFDSATGMERAAKYVDVNAAGSEDCPPCEGCPPCPVSTRKAPAKVCNGTAKPDSWGLVTCNDIMHLAATQVRGVGGDSWWPPTQNRSWSADTIRGQDTVVHPACTASFGEHPLARLTALAVRLHSDAAVLQRRRGCTEGHSWLTATGTGSRRTTRR